MASPQTPSNAARKPSASPAASSGFVYLPLIAGWLVPGAGHFLQGKWGRGALLAASVLGMFVTGLAMQGKLFSSVHDILDLLGFVGDLGNGLLFIIGRIAKGLAPIRCRLRRRTGGHDSLKWPAC